MTAPTLSQPAINPDVSAPVHTGGMVALVPTAESAVSLAVAGGLPAGELHLTLCYLGDDVTTWPPEVVNAVLQAAREITNAPLDDDAPVPAGLMQGPLTLNVFAWSQFNPNGGPEGQDPCLVYQFSGDADYVQVENFAGCVQAEMKDAVGEAYFPEQHSRFEPHVTAGEGLPPNALSYTGPVTFDRLRVALADRVIDLPLGGDPDMTAAVTAKQRSKSQDNSDTYPGTDKFPVTTRDQFKAAVGLAGSSDLPPAKVRKWLMRKAKQKGWEDLVPDSWNADGTLTASAEPVDDTQRAAVTAAAVALVDKLGPNGAYATAPLVFPSPALLTVVDNAIELPDADPALTASADTTELPTLDMFTPPPDMPPGTGHYVDGRRVYGRLAEWNVPHIGIDGKRVFPPRSKSGYRWFHTKTARVAGANGPERLKVGHLTFGIGHAGLGMDHLSAAAHYDNSGYRGAKVRMTEDDQGIAYAGALVSGIEGPRLEEFEESDTSGDWRFIMGGLELVAALCVNVGGFPKVGLSLAASGEPYALVASAKSWGHTGVIDYDLLADTVADRVIKRQAMTAALTTKRNELLASLDDSDERMMGLLVDLYDEDFDELTAAISTMPPRLRESYLHGKAAAKINWGVPGDFDRCVAEAIHHGIPGRMRKGMCSTLHHEALGVWPGQEKGKKK